MPGTTHSLTRLREIEDFIEEAMWRSGEDCDYSTAVRIHEDLEDELRSLSNPSEHEESERLRALSYCIMCHTDAMEHVDKSYDSMKRSKEALGLAERLGSGVQALRAKMALSVALLNKGQLTEAEKHFAAIIMETYCTSTRSLWRTLSTSRRRRNSKRWRRTLSTIGSGISRSVSSPERRYWVSFPSSIFYTTLRGGP